MHPPAAASKTFHPDFVMLAPIVRHDRRYWAARFFLGALVCVAALMFCLARAMTADSMTAAALWFLGTVLSTLVALVWAIWGDHMPYYYEHSITPHLVDRFDAWATSETVQFADTTKTIRQILAARSETPWSITTPTSTGDKVQITGDNYSGAIRITAA